MEDGELLHCRENPHLIGHDEAQKIFLEAIEGDRISGSWLISGPKGIGKATLAYRLARYIFANDSSTNNGLLSDAGVSKNLDIGGDHQIFKRMAQGSLGDLMVVEVDEEAGKREISVESVRKIGTFLSQTASETCWRIVIVDSADDLNRNAANALLKMLEEPPKNTIMLLVSHSPGRLLPTIRSRCRSVTLRPLADEQMHQVLRLMDNQFDIDEAEFATYVADGSPGFASELYIKNGFDLYRHCIEILSFVPDIDVVAVQKLGENLALKNSQSDWRIVISLLEWFLAKIVNSYVSGDSIPEFIAGEGDVRNKLLDIYSVDQLIELWEKVGRIVAQSDGLNMDRKLATQQIFGSFAKV